MIYHSVSETAFYGSLRTENVSLVSSGQCPMGVCVCVRVCMNTCLLILIIIITTDYKAHTQNTESLNLLVISWILKYMPSLTDA